MSKLVCTDRHFSIFSDLNSPVRCFIVYDRFDGQLSAKELMDLINETENLAPIAYFQKQLFLVDTQIFTNCFIFEVAFKGISTNLDFFAFEAIAAAEMVWVCDRIREFYGPRAK